MSATSLALQRNVRGSGSRTDLLDLLDLRIRNRPDATAVTGDDGDLTFRGLGEESGRIADLLTRHGIGADQCVGLYAHPGPDLVVGVWGVLASGGAYLPLSPDYPDERLRFMIRDSGLDAVLVQPALAARMRELAPSSVRVLPLRGEPEAPSGRAEPHGGGAAPARPRAARPSDLAYVIYTSGSTGTPKGVMIERRSVVSQLRWLGNVGHLGEDVRILQKTPMSFDAAQWEILACAAGATVVTVRPGAYRDPEALIDAVARHRATVLQGVPTLLQGMVDTERLDACTTLRRVFSGGEPLSPRLARALLTALPGADLVNLYGPTECTINATAHLIDPDELDDAATSVPVGVPVDNTHCYVLDEAMAPVGLGATGELYIGGRQLARGYLHRVDLTEERFVPSPFVPTERLYRTGDLARWNDDGTLTCLGRTDGQVKLRGHRVELDEVALTVEHHPWVRRAAAVVADDARTGQAALVACVELNPREAALMDQGNHGGHHQSKSDKLQVKAQLAGLGLREPDELDGRAAHPLPGRTADARTRAEAFARKTYRHFEGGPVARADVEALLSAPAPVPAPRPAGSGLTWQELGDVLRRLGPFHSEERLLPKYAYASPGALYATQLYLELDGRYAEQGLSAGTYYFHPEDHALVRVGDAAEGHTGVLLHFSGKRRAIAPVYANNIREVLEFETGHMVGLLEEVLAPYGLAPVPAGAAAPAKKRLDVAHDDLFLGTFALSPDPEPWGEVDAFVQAHPGRIADLAAGHYRWDGGGLERICDDLLLRNHVIAINQQVYDASSFGVSAVARTPEPWLEYVSMGRYLHRLQSAGARDGVRIGLMSSGYSSKSGNPLPAALRLDAILGGAGIASGPSYFFLGGKVGEEQIRSEGMHEDAVHMRGPAEIVRDDLARTLPDYMVPNRVVVLDALPLTANGKVDAKALAADEKVTSGLGSARYVEPGTEHERWLADEWGRALKYEQVSAEDDFFAAGGDSLTAVSLVHRINRAFGTGLPLQVVFEAPRLADLAARIADAAGGQGGGSRDGAASRLVPLRPDGHRAPVYCWPGLGGYPMNLRLLARTAAAGRPFFGVQAHGVNAGEEPYATVQEMAAADVEEIRRRHPGGPYTLWGYSFGARVAFEAAWQLERQGGEVDRLLLICPGNPKVRQARAERHGREADFADPAYVAVLYSVFAGTVTGAGVEECLAAAHDEESFTAFVDRAVPGLGPDLIRRIVRIVAQTYAFEYRFEELAERRLRAPVTVIKATGDDYSFIEGASGFSAEPPRTVQLEADHYSVLKPSGVDELARAIADAGA